MVVDFVVGRVLSHNGKPESTEGLDDVTTYYILHRHDFGLEKTPVGPCILYAISCGLSDHELADKFDILAKGGSSKGKDDEDEDETEENASSGSEVKLKSWSQRKRKNMGYESVAGRPIPFIDQLHCVMHLWKAGEQIKVDEYLDKGGLRKNELFAQLLQALIELSASGSEERSLLESVSNHLKASGRRDDRQGLLI